MNSFKWQKTSLNLLNSDKLAMKIAIYTTLLTLLCTNLFGQERRFRETTKYRRDKNSLIQWDKLDPVDYLDYDLWLINTKLKDKWPSWEKTVREKRQKENYGKILHCVGTCRIYRGVGHYKTQFRSNILEGDELITDNDSYAWVFIVDGTLVRISPNSSITFREINIGVKETFLHARINSGNILWLSRKNDKYKVNNDRETDSIFLPLDFYEAMPITEKPVLDEENLFKLLERTNTVEKQYLRLNSLVEENNKLIKNRKTYSFLVSPNGTVSGESLNVEFISLIGNESFVKARKNTQLGLDTEDESKKAHFFFRGFDSKESEILDPGSWYRIGKKGRTLGKYFDTQLQQIGELLTKRIPSILVARELLLKRYGTYISFTDDSEKLARAFNYRQWGDRSVKKSDMSLRLNFLKEYTRRMETTNLVTSGRLREKLLIRGEPTDDMDYSIKFFNKALVNYMRQNHSSEIIRSDREVLNSTTKKFWKIINDIK
jgi:hypothetical protein